MTHITPDSTIPEVVKRIDYILTAEDSPWESTLIAVLHVLSEHIPKLTWSGFYLVEKLGVALNRGPFLATEEGPSRLGWREGVIGSCAYERAVQILGDTKRFEGYIGAVRETRSELAVPVVRDGRVLAVLDAQAPAIDAFGIVEAELFQQIADRLARMWH